MKIDANIKVTLTPEQQKEVALNYLNNLLKNSNVYYNVEHDTLFVDRIIIDDLQDPHSLRLREIANAIKTIHTHGI